MTTKRKRIDPLLTIEFLALTLACGSRPDAEPTTTSQTEEESTSTTQPSDEDTNVDDWTIGGGFLDYGEYDLYYECDPLGSDCPAGEKCVPVSNDDGKFNRAVCVPLLGDIPPGEPCTKPDPSTGHDDCDATSMCWFLEGETGVCAPLCSGFPDDSICPDGLSCFHQANALWVCVAPCDPLAQDCPTGQACHWHGTGFGCSPSNDVPPPEPCASLFDCAAGSICLVAEVLDNCDGDSCCTAYCNTEDPEGCAAAPGTACTSFWDQDGPPTPELATVGVCLSP